MKFLSIFLICILAISLAGLYNFNYAFAAEVDDRLTIKSSKKMASFGEEVVFSGKLVNRNGDPVSSAEILLWRTDGIKVEIVRGGEAKTNAFGEYSISIIIKNWNYDINNLKYYTVSSLINAKSIKIPITIGESIKSNQNISKEIVPKVRDVTQERSSSQINPTTNTVKTSNDNLYRDSAYKIKQSYYEALTLLESGIKLSESSLSDIVLEDTETKKQIDAAVKHRVIASNSIAKAKSSLYVVESYLKDYEYQKAWNKLQEIDNHISSSKNNISGITKEIIDAQKLEDDYQEKNKFCFLFWCNVKAQNEDLDLQIKDIELIIEKIYTKEQKIYSEQQRLDQKLQLAKQERDSQAKLDGKQREILQHQEIERQQQAELDRKQREILKQQEIERQQQAELDRKQKELREQQYQAQLEQQRLENLRELEQRNYEEQIKAQEQSTLYILASTNPLLKQIMTGEITFFAEPVPYYAAPGVETGVENILNGFNNWKGVKRVYERPGADIKINWVKEFSPGLGGQHWQSHVQVGLGWTTYYGKWQPFTSHSVQQVLWHEIGHAMGYGHSSDQNNIMMGKGLEKFFYNEYEDDIFLRDGSYSSIKFYRGGQYSFQLNGNSESSGFRFYVITPETDAREFISEGIGKHYPDCTSSGTWVSYGKTCNVAKGSKLVLYNPSDNGEHINVDVLTRYTGSKTTYDMTWDKNALKESSLQYLQYLDKLR